MIAGATYQTSEEAQPAGQDRRIQSHIRQARMAKGKARHGMAQVHEHDSGARLAGCPPADQERRRRRRRKRGACFQGCDYPRPGEATPKPKPKGQASSGSGMRHEARGMAWWSGMGVAA